ncbi:MAG: hypothetical protein SWX82_10525 [Cyanobacteriota bacterium]|nr:hypothetical protein [Cyanobacteriota bacterium]
MQRLFICSKYLSNWYYIESGYIIYVDHSIITSISPTPPLPHSPTPYSLLPTPAHQRNFVPHAS